MSADRDTTRIVRSWLDEGVTALPDRVLDAVLDQVPATPQRRGGWPARRFPLMNKIVGFGPAAAAVVAVVLIGSQLLGSPGNFGGSGTQPSPTPEPSTGEPSVEPSVAEPTSPSGCCVPPGGSLDVGGFVFDEEAVPITVTIPASGWSVLPEFSALQKGDQADPPNGAGAALLAWAITDPINVYGDPCHWSSTSPETPATTVDEIAAALAAQASRDATAPVNVTVGGYAGKYITLHVPNDAPTRDEAFADCDENTFASYGYEGDSGPARYHQGPGQIDELWILDVRGAIVILDATYSPATPAGLVEEVRSMAEGATFSEVP